MSDEEESAFMQEMPKETVRDTVMRDPVTGKFLKGTKAGPGRPKGRLDQLNVQVVSTLEALWTERGAEIINQLAAERPEVVAQLVARLIPQSLAAEAISGEVGKGETDQQVTIRVVADQRQDVLPPREVEGELLDRPTDDASVINDTTH
jgi:hypothetical protein